MKEERTKRLQDLKSYKKEILLIGLGDYQIRAIVDFGMNRILYRVGNLDKTNLTDTLDKAIELITEMVEKDIK